MSDTGISQSPKICEGCGFGNLRNAKFCSECGQKIVGDSASAPSGEAIFSGSEAETQSQSADARAAIQQLFSSLSAEDTSQKLRSFIEANRAQLKTLGAMIPRATNPLIVSLMDSLKALPDSEVSARIAIVTALGRTGDAAILPPLLLVTSSQSREVRKATAIALGGIRHPLAAYLLLPMLQDGSSRVRQAALQALIQLNQPQTIQSVVAACLCSKTLRTLILETLRLVSESKRSTFFELLRQMPVNEHPELQTVANWLRFEFKESRAAAPKTPLIATARSVKPATSTATSLPEFREGEAPAKPQAVENPKHLMAHHKLRSPADARDEATGQAPGSIVQTPTKRPSALPTEKVELPSQESSIFSWGKPETTQPASVNGPASVRRQNAGGSAVAESPSVDNYEITADFGDDDEFESDVRLLSDSSGAYQKFFSSMVENLLTTSQNEMDFVGHTASAPNSDALQEFSSISGLLSDSQVPQRVNGQNDDDDDRGELEFASSGSQAFMSLSGMLEAPKLPLQHNQQNSRAIQPGSKTLRAAEVSGKAGLASPVVPRTSTPHSAFDTATVMGNTPGSSVPMMPFMHPAAMHPAAIHPGAIPPGVAPMNGMYGASMNPAGMPGPPAFDMTASSPLIPAFTTATPQAAAVSATLHAAGQAGSDVSSSVGQASDASALIKAALAEAEENAIEELEAEQARARVVHEKALARLSAAREGAFRVLLKDADNLPKTLPKTLPRLLRKRVSTLMATPSTKIEQITEQIRELGETNSPAALATLATFSQKPAKQIREACAEALGSINHPGSAVFLMKLLADKSGTVVEATIKSMAKLDLAPTRPVLLAAGQCGSSLRRVVTASVESSADEKKPEWEEFLLENLRSDDTDNAAFAVSLLARIAGEKTHLEIFQELATHKAPELRAAAVEALSRTQAKRAISQINAALEDPEPGVRAQAALSVATMYSPRSIELLQKLVFDTNLNVRRNAAQSMSRIDEPELAATIARALDQETDATTVEYLLAALQRNGANSSLPILQRYIEGESSQFREQAVKALRKLKIPASVPIFRRLLDDSSASLRRQGVEQLAVLMSESALSRLREMLKKDPDEIVRSACAKALGDFGDDTALNLLEEALEDHPLVRLQAVIALGRLGQSSAGPILLSLMRDQLPEVRYQAVRAIAQLKLEGVEEQIVPLLEDSNEMVRRGAEKSLTDLGHSIGAIRSNRLKNRVVGLMSKLVPSSIAFAIPGGSKSLLAAMSLMALLAIGYGVSSLATASFPEKVEIDNVRTASFSNSDNLLAVLRDGGLFELWSPDEGLLKERRVMPRDTTHAIMLDEKRILFLSESSIAIHSIDSGTISENSIVQNSWDSLVLHAILNKKGNAIFLFTLKGDGTEIHKVSFESLSIEKTFVVPFKVGGIATVSPDEKIMATMVSNDTMTLFDLTTGERIEAPLKNICGVESPGIISIIEFASDMKHLAIAGSTLGLAVIEVDTLTQLNRVSAGMSGNFASAKFGVSPGHLTASTGGGYFVMLSDSFQKVDSGTVDGFGFADRVVFDASAKRAAFMDDDDEYGVWIVDLAKKQLVHHLDPLKF